MPNMRTKAQAIALAIGDIHLSLRPPPCRAEEPDWLGAQARALQHVCKLQQEYDVPVLIAGDIFHQWNAPAELISFAIDNLPKDVISVAGNHDLPYHSISEIMRSAYGVLISANRILDVSAGERVGLRIKGWHVKGGGWGAGMPLSEEGTNSIALIHRYCWTKGKNPAQGIEAKDIASTQYAKQLKGFRVAVFGDNHHGFSARAGKCNVWNCGCLIRRRADEESLQPAVGIIYSDGSVAPNYLDIAQDLFDRKAKDVEPAGTVDISEFKGRLEGLRDTGLDFRSVVEHHVKQADLAPGVRNWILKALEQHE